MLSCGYATQDYSYYKPPSNYVTCNTNCQTLRRRRQKNILIIIYSKIFSGGMLLSKKDEIQAFFCENMFAKYGCNAHDMGLIVTCKMRDKNSVHLGVISMKIYTVKRSKMLSLVGW
jgi:hypothetical protein